MTFVTYTYFAIQTGFIFLPQASGVKDEYIYNTRPQEYNNTAVFEAIKELNIDGLPKIDNCSVEANAIRDDLKMYLNTSDADVYRIWNTGKGCEHGTALDQMTMTYTSFTGYLRYFFED